MDWGGTVLDPVAGYTRVMSLRWKNISIAVFLILCVTSGIGVYFSARKSEDEKKRNFDTGNAALTQATITPPSPIGKTPVSGWKTYRYPVIGLVLQYPLDWEVANMGEGCGPILGPKAKPDAGLPVYPYITLCHVGTSNFENDHATILSAPQTILGSVEQGDIDGHQFFKIRMNPANSREDSVYTILIDIHKQNPERPFNLIIYTFFSEEEYKKMGTEKQVNLEEFISTIDQILSTIKFEK
jgi:hypothetical protein